ncbi:MAG: hypothetical protein ABFD89_26630 [Bryobacteraceae bacterium]
MIDTAADITQHQLFEFEFEALASMQDLTVGTPYWFKVNDGDPVEGNITHSWTVGDKRMCRVKLAQAVPITFF